MWKTTAFTRAALIAKVAAGAAAYLGVLAGLMYPVLRAAGYLG